MLDDATLNKDTSSFYNMFDTNEFFQALINAMTIIINNTYYNTVMIIGLDQNYLNKIFQFLFKDNIRESISNYNNIKVYFDFLIHTLNVIENTNNTITLSNLDNFFSYLHIINFHFDFFISLCKTQNPFTNPEHLACIFTVINKIISISDNNNIEVIDFLKIFKLEY